MAQAAWKGAVDLGGFPVNVRLYNRIGRGSGGGGFKMLSPVTEGPVSQKYIDEDGNQFKAGECAKGVEHGDGHVILGQNALDQIKAGERTPSVEPRQFVPLDSIDMSTASGTYEVIADKDVPGSEKPVKILFNGLKGSGKAYVTQLVMRAGSRDSVLAFYAEGKRLRAVTLPFADALNEPPEGSEFEDDEKAQAVFEQFVETQYSEIVGDYEPAKFESEWAARREDVLETVLSGKTVQPAPELKPPSGGPDLMDVLEASVESASKKKPAKKPAKKAKAKSKKVAA